MVALSSSASNPVASPSTQRWWQRLEERWNEVQVGRQGSYSVERLESFDHYCKTSSQIRVLLVCVLTPLPALLTAVLLECLPLRPPSESWTAHWVFWIRLGLTNFAMCFAGTSQLTLLVPELYPTFLKKCMLCGGAISAYLTIFLLGANVVGFPIPFTWYIGGFFMTVFIPVMLLFIFGRNTFASSSPCRPNLLRFLGHFHAFMALMHIFCSGFRPYGPYTYPLKLHWLPRLPGLPIPGGQDSGRPFSLGFTQRAAEEHKQHYHSICWWLWAFQRPRWCSVCKSSTYYIFPLCKVLYSFVPVVYRGFIAVVLPVWRLAAKQFMVHSTRKMEDFIPEIVAMAVDYFSALFVCVSISVTGSIYLLLLFIAADLMQSVLEFREVRMNANAVFDLLRDLKKNVCKHEGTTDTINLVGLVVSVTRDPKAFGVVSLRGIRLEASYPHRVAREQSEKLRVLQEMYSESEASSPTRSKKNHTRRERPPQRMRVQRAKIKPITRTPGDTADPVFTASPRYIARDQAKRLVLQGFQLMFHCEYLILVEYVECIVPLMFVLYKTVLQYLPNVVYYPEGAGHVGSAAAANILVYAGLEVISLFLLHIFLQRKFAFSPLYQLAFVLETQVYMVQAQLFIESIFLLQYELAHYGTDFTFQFKWLFETM